MVASLTRLTRNAVSFEWSDACQQAFEAVKLALVQAPVLATPDFGQPFTVIVDASGEGIGAVLEQDGHPLAYESRKFTPAERSYTVGEQELLAAVHAMKVWRCYLEGGRCTLVTDHNPNTYLKTVGTLSRRMTRWVEYLERFDYDWVYRPGRVNVADPLSRSPANGPLFVGAVRTRPARENAQAAAAPSVVDKVQEGYAADADYAKAEFTSKLESRDQLWWHGEQLAVPSPCVQECIKEHHHSPLFGHGGGKKTLEALLSHFWWPHMRATVEQYVSTCDGCQRMKASTTKPAGLLQPLQIPEGTWESVSMDLITQLPMTKLGHDAIVVFVDRMSKMVHFAPTTTEVSAKGVATLLRHHVLRLHGVPADLVTDRDKRFSAKFMRDLCKTLQISQSMSTAYHPQSDGQTERMNRVLEDMLRQYVNPTQDDWDQHLDMAEFAVNNSYSESIRTTPFEMVYGKLPLTPISMDRRLRGNNPAADSLAERLQKNLHQAKTSLQAAQQRMRTHADRRRREVHFSEGQQVMLSARNIKLKGVGTPKLLPRWLGPFKITAMVGPVAARLELPTTALIHDVFHVSLLKHYRSDGRVQPPPPTFVLDGQEEYEVERILAHRQRGKGNAVKTEFLIKWLGYAVEHNTWEPEANAQHAPEKLAEYWAGVRTGTVAKTIGRRRPRTKK